MVAASTYLVTGGGGFLGSSIVRMLVERGDCVRTFSRSRYAALDRLGVEQVKGDLADAQAVRNACQGVEAVFHVAAKPGIWGAYDSYHRPNVLGTRNVIEGCKNAGAARLIYTSSPSVVFDGSDMAGVDESVPYPAHFHAHYPKTKALAEQLVIAAGASGLPSVSLRPHLIWGPGDTHLVPRLIARAHRLHQIGDGSNKVDTIYVDNAALAHLQADAALKRSPRLSGNVYFISQDAPIALWTMVNHILAAGGKPAIQKQMSPAMAYRIGALLEGIYTLLRIKAEPPMTRFVARELATSHWFDISAAKRDLDYAPVVSTEEGLTRLAQWLASS
jgi:nucleoside-diphosphate-sugar epimerase